MAGQPNWDLETNQVVENLVKLIQIDTTNPPGNELPAILLVKQILEENGFPPERITIVEAAPGRANIVARIHGDGSKRPLLLSGHVDVVPVERDKWTHDPFGGEVIEGYIWGRGALDMKGLLAIYIQVFLCAFRSGLPLKRDLILAAIADEEAGFRHGSGFLVHQHRELIEAEFGLTEGGAMTIHMGKLRLYPIQVAEKGICWLRMIANGQPGHGSVPHRDNAVFHLVQAMERIRRAGGLPVHLTPTVESMLSSAAAQLKAPARWLPLLMRNAAFARLILKLMPEKNKGLLSAMLTNTVTPTILQAGQKTNVIPSVAEAHLDCRILPGQTLESLKAEILRVTGEKVTLEPIVSIEATQFSTETPLYKLLERETRRMDPQGVVVPILMPGGTDASQYQKAGISMYGFTPGVLPKDYPLIKMGHGHDERYPISAIRTGLPVLWNVVNEFCCS